jgi:hypothetical protein
VFSSQKTGFPLRFAAGMTNKTGEQVNTILTSLISISRSSCYPVNGSENLAFLFEQERISSV